MDQKAAEVEAGESQACLWRYLFFVKIFKSSKEVLDEWLYLVSCKYCQPLLRKPLEKR